MYEVASVYGGGGVTALSAPTEGLKDVCVCACRVTHQSRQTLSTQFFTLCLCVSVPVCVCVGWCGYHSPINIFFVGGAPAM